MNRKVLLTYMLISALPSAELSEFRRIFAKIAKINYFYTFG